MLIEMAINVIEGFKNDVKELRLIKDKENNELFTIVKKELEYFNPDDNLYECPLYLKKDYLDCIEEFIKRIKKTKEQMFLDDYRITELNNAQKDYERMLLNTKEIIL